LDWRFWLFADLVVGCELPGVSLLHEETLKRAQTLRPFFVRWSAMFEAIDDA